MKIWAKTIDEENVKIKDTVYETELKLTVENYDVILREIAEKLDIATPLSILSQFKHLKEFNTHRYNRDDFVESVDFKALILEIFREKD